MKLIKILVFLTLTLTTQTNLFAETWNEPWQKEIIQKADYFVLANVLSNIEGIGTKIEIIKSFGTQNISGEILINSFSLLKLSSASGHGVHLDFKKGQTIYFLLTKRDDGNYAIPTPTSGFAVMDADKNVYATYRHSYHQTLVSQELYEKTYTEIWNYYKTSKFDKKNVSQFINENIDKAPASFDEEEISTFFLQHAALETAYLLDFPIELNRLKKFVNCDNFHSRVSALQLLSTSKKNYTKDFLFEYIKDEKNENFEKVIAIWSLTKIGGKEYSEKLISITDLLSDEETGFDSNLMDPRIATHFPSPKSAVEALL